MSTNTTQAASPVRQQQAQVKPTIGSTFGNILTAVNSSLSAVNNTALILDNVTGALADKSARYREQSAIADAITHNQLMAEYENQAKKLGLDF